VTICSGVCPFGHKEEGDVSTTLTRRDSRFFTHTLPNGLQMIGQQIPGVQSVAAVFWVKTGTRDESRAEMGVSHFLEHMAFRHTLSFSGEEIDRLFEEMGADHNAATSWEMTYYWLRVLRENLSTGLKVLAELTHPLLDEESFAMERNVIREEIARYQDQPSHILIRSFMENFYGNHPLSMETLGTPETLNALTVEQMRAYWERRYGTRNMIFSIAGNFDWNEVVAQISELSADWQAGETGRELPAATFRPSVNVYPTDRFGQEQIAIGVPSVSRSDPRYYAAATLATILGDDTGSRLFWALNQTGLAESASAQLLEFEDTGLMIVYLVTEPSLAPHVLQVAQRELERVQAFDIEQAELDRAKAKLVASVVIGGESTNERVIGLISSWLTRGRLETLEEVREKIEGITLDDLKAVVDELPVWPNAVVTASGPVTKDVLLEGRLSST
jgi:predicted Zn-dependent peptidase